MFNVGQNEGLLNDAMQTAARLGRQSQMTKAGETTRRRVQCDTREIHLNLSV